MPQAIKDHRFKFTLAKIDDLDFPDSGQSIYHDTVVPALALRVTPTKKSYLAIGRVNGQHCRVTLGEHGNLLLEAARTAAQATIGDMARGVNPIAEKKKAKAQAQSSARTQKQNEANTLDAVWQEYRQARALRPRTVELYSWVLKHCLKDWLLLPVVQISKDMVQKRYEKLLAKGWTAQAHLAMRTLRALMNYAIAVNEDEKGESLIKVNPVARLSQAKLWRKVTKRTTIIPTNELKDWYGAVATVSPNVRDVLLVALWTGLRRGEITRLKWQDIDLKRKTLRIPPENSKNHKEHVLPLSTFLYDLLKARKDRRDSSKVRRLNSDEYVFPGVGKSGHMVEPKRGLMEVKKATDIKFGLHDLRRTFCSCAERLVPHYTLKRLMNHSDGPDVTAGYTIRSVDDLRDDVEKISVFLIQKTGAKIRTRRTRTSSRQKVVALKAKKAKAQ